MNQSHTLRGRTVLVVEDDDATREMTGQLLEAFGARVTLAADGFEGLQLLARRQPDAVLCDLTMPIMDGLEFAQRMRSIPRYERVLLIAITGRDGHNEVMDTWRAGFDGHVVKPVTGEAWNALIQRLGRSGTVRTNEGA